MSFISLGLGPKIIRALEDNGYKNPSPIQAQAIPAILAGEDVIACAQTGTGKTAAFSLPLLERIAAKSESWRQTTVLVLSPTRELACQIVMNMEKYGKHLPVRCCAIYGGVNMEKQIRVLCKGVQIVVATPGRLLDHLRQRTIDLSHIDTLVLDEADSMLDMGFIRDVRRIIAALPKSRRQNLLFSATFSTAIRSLTKEILYKPKVIQVTKENTPIEAIDQVVYSVDRSRRRALLSHLIGKESWEQVLVFIRTKHQANRLAEQLTLDGYEAKAFHSNKSQGVRTQTLNSFKQGKIRVLVATDIAARGIDIQDLPHVVNYDLPQIPENYVHRIGRTGRAGRKGQALSLVSSDDAKMLHSIESLLRIRIPQKVIPGYEPTSGLISQPPQNRRSTSSRKNKRNTNRFSRRA